MYWRRIGCRGARLDRDDAGLAHELAWLLEHPALGVPEVVQPVDELPLGERLATPELEGPSKDTRQHALAGALQALIDQPGERYVVVACGEGDEHRRNRDRESSEAHPLVAPGGPEANPQAFHGMPGTVKVIC
jgi:hypothetical protein